MNNMKKYLILAAAAVAALAACSKVEADLSSMPDVKIGYQVASYSQQTKANSETSFIDELTELGVSTKAFESKAFIHAAQADGTVAAPATFFNAGSNGVETVSWDGSEWAPAHPYYWPKSPKSSLSFFSWYDKTGAQPTLSGYTDDGDNVTLAWENRTVDLKDNVLYANGAYHYKANVSTYHIDAASVTGVPTLFHHALAKVRFTVAAAKVEKADTKNNGYKTFWKVTLSDVALSSGTIKNNGNLTLTEKSSTTTETVNWTKPSNEIWGTPTASQTYLTSNLGTASGGIFDTDVAKGNTALTENAVALTSDQFMNNNYFTVLPQEVADNVTLTFKYTVETRYGNNTFDTATPISIETINVNDLAGTAPYLASGIQLNVIGTNPIAKWQMNHQYVYNIIIDPESDRILYDPAVEAWADAEEAAVTVPHTN